LSVRAFATEEKHDAIWVWLGPEPADPELIPDFSFIDRTKREARVKGYLNSEADYRLMVDNIMDLTHADYLHSSSLGGGINSRAKASVEQAGNSVSITWTALDDTLAPLHAQVVPGCSGRGDMLNQVDWFAPGTMRQRLLLALPGELESNGMDSVTCHVMTPEREGRTHYFFCHTSDAVSARPEIGPAIKEALTGAFAGEDSPMLVAQTQRINGRDFWSMKPAMLPSDKGAVLVRRALDRLIDNEEVEKTP
ncbi:MAG: aromatic ring-hydroxylating dioxygenase subunit alpha, partial [Sphingomonadaceae bacterium]